MTHHADTPCPKGEARPPIAVLLVDDQRFIATAVGRLLATETDIALHCCYHAADAVEQANHLEPAVILQDLVLPDIDGLTLVGLFRSNPPTAHTPIIVLSGNDDAAARTRALASGADDYLVKLPPKDELIACIRRHVAGPPAGAGGPLAEATRPRAEGDARDRPAASCDTSDETLDRSVIATFRLAGGAGSPDFAAMLIDQFMREAASQVCTLRDAAERLDAAVLKATAHSLKGSSLTMGARRLAALCTQLEDHLERHPGDAVTPLMAAVDEELVRVRDAFAVERI